MERGKLLVHLALNKETESIVENNLKNKISEIKGLCMRNALSELQVESATDKVYHYLQNVQLPELNKNIVPKDPYEFELSEDSNITKNNNCEYILRDTVDKYQFMSLPSDEIKTNEFISNDDILGSLNSEDIMHLPETLRSKKGEKNVGLDNKLLLPSQKLSCSEEIIDKIDVIENRIIKQGTCLNSAISNNGTNKFSFKNTNKCYTQDNSILNKERNNNKNILEESESEHINSDSLSEHIPPTESDVSESSREIPLQFFSRRRCTLERSLETPIYSQSRNTKFNGSKDLCPFCFESVGHFSRHLFRKHSDEETIKKIMKMPLRSSDRRVAVIALRRKGNFILKQKRDELKPVRKQKSQPAGDYEYFPCVNCLGYYKKTYLWRHNKKCKSNQNTIQKGARKQHLTDAQTFLASTGLLGNYLHKSRLKEQVFSIMRPDKISSVAKCDPLICLYGESYMNKHKRNQMNLVVSNKLRELARLKIALQKITTIDMLADALKPEMYKYIVAACKIVSGYDPSKRTFKASSLALHMGTNLKYVCDVARKAFITKDPLFHLTDIEKKIKEVSELRELIAHHWCNDVSSLANKVLNEKKWEKPKLLPVTEDINIFKNYVNKMLDEAYDNLHKQENITYNYKILAECTLSLLLVFNRKRIGEIQFLDIQTYNRDFSTINQDECLSSLSELEKSMCKIFKRVVVFGKGSRPVPILFTKKMQKCIDLLLHVRRTSDIVSDSNQYIFANPGSDRWMSGASVLRKFALKSGAKNPELLTSTKFRKQIATILQLMTFEKDEMEQIARFLGHSEKTHAEFYRLTEDIYQTAKVAKVLLLLNAGKGSELKGKNLTEIEVAEEFIDYDEGEDEREQKDMIDTEQINSRDLVEIDLYQTKQTNYNSDNDLDHMDVATSYSKKNKKEEIRTSGSVGQGDTKLKKGRKQWTTEQKQLVLKYFKRHVRNKIPPKKNECTTLIRQNLGLFQEDDWVRVKTFVYNTYRTQ